jgi:predicted nucleic acid-binding protein
MTYYLDSSAIVKLVRTEPETAALLAWLGSGVDTVTSDLARTEVTGAVLRHDPAAAAQAAAVLATLDSLRLDTRDYAQAGILGPVELRTLDALHLAAALTLQPDLEGLVTYDARLALGAAAAGVTAIAPGRTPTVTPPA